MIEKLKAVIDSLPDELPELNEQDVREEILAPILSSLGYSTFGPNQINREREIRYPYQQLGRKGKKGKKRLIAKPDYELSAGPHHKIVIEAKSTKINISEDDIDQAYTYAAHPEVKAVVYIVTNGRKIFIFHTFNANPYQPIREINYAELKFLPESLIFLAPNNVQQNFPLPKKDLGVPIIVARSSSKMRGAGQLAFSHGENIILGQNQDMAIISDHPSDISDCEIKRKDDGRIQIHFDAISRNKYVRDFQEKIGFNTINAIAHDAYISTDFNKPTLFTGDYNLILDSGTEMLDPASGQRVLIPIDLMILQRFSALVVINGDIANFMFEGKMSMYTPENAIGSGRYIGGGQISLTKTNVSL